MPRFEYTPQVSLGAILQIITIIGAIVGAYVTFANRLVIQEERTAVNSVEIARVEKKTDATMAELKELNKTLTGMDEKITKYIIMNMEYQLQNRNASQTRSR